jgi:hypothetical protein
MYHIYITVSAETDFLFLQFMKLSFSFSSEMFSTCKFQNKFDYLILRSGLLVIKLSQT